jgi:hypothetical protein
MQKQLKRKRATSLKSVSSGSVLSEQKFGQQSSLIETELSDSSQLGEHAVTKESSTRTLPKTAEEFDRRFDEGEDVFDLGVSKEGWTRPGLVSKRFNVDVPAQLLEKLDDAALLRGVTRQALVKTWLYDRLMQERSK